MPYAGKANAVWVYVSDASTVKHKDGAWVVVVVVVVIVLLLVVVVLVVGTESCCRSITESCHHVNALEPSWGISRSTARCEVSTPPTPHPPSQPSPSQPAERRHPLRIVQVSDGLGPGLHGVPVRRGHGRADAVPILRHV